MHFHSFKCPKKKKKKKASSLKVAVITHGVLLLFKTQEQRLLSCAIIQFSVFWENPIQE